MSMNIKQKLLGNSLGRLALSFRNKINILLTAYYDIENVSTLANDQLATKLVTTICQSRMTFIDVGVHLGSIISEVAYHDPSIKIVGIEAVPDKVVNLQRKFPFVSFHNCAVGETTGEMPFFVNTKNSGYSSLGKATAVKEESVISEIKVSVKKLDELITSDDVDVIKIDVEGAELGVLLGSLKILTNNRPIIMFESGPQQNDGLGYTKEALYQLLNLNKYAVLVPNRVAHNDPGLTLDGFIESHLYPRRTTNYFAIPKERRIQVRDKARKILKTSVS